MRGDDSYRLRPAARTRLLCYLVVAQLVSRASTGQWLRTDHLVEAADNVSRSQGLAPLLGHPQEVVGAFRQTKTGGRVKQGIDQGAAFRVVLDAVQESVGGAGVAQLPELDESCRCHLGSRSVSPFCERCRASRHGPRCWN